MLFSPVRDTLSPLESKIGMPDLTSGKLYDHAWSTPGGNRSMLGPPQLPLRGSEKNKRRLQPIGCRLVVVWLPPQSIEK